MTDMVYTDKSKITDCFVYRCTDSLIEDSWAESLVATIEVRLHNVRQLSYSKGAAN